MASGDDDVPPGLSLRRSSTTRFCPGGLLSQNAEALQVAIPTGAGSIPSPKDVSSAIRSLLSSGLGAGRIRATDSILVLADTLASARAIEFGRRLDRGERVTARSSVDLEVTESIRSIDRLDSGWDGSIWVSTGPTPGPWTRGVDHILGVEPDAGDGDGPSGWTATLRSPNPSGDQGDLEPLLPEDDLDIVRCVIGSALASDFDGHRSAFTARAPRPLTAASWGPSRGWVGSTSPACVSSMSLVEDLTLAVQSIVDSVRPDFRRLVVLGAAQYSAAPGDASANAEFAVPRDLTLLDPTTGRPTSMPVLSMSHACASVLYSLDLARTVLRDPRVDTVIVASASVPSVAATESMAAVRALTSGQARPFADDRDGIILGLGGGAVCVQRASSAGGDHPPGVLGRITAISTRVAGRSASSQSAAEVVAVLDQLNVTPDVVIAHATGTPTGDLVEIEAINSWIRPQNLPTPVPVVSHKGASGHLLHASGLLGVAHALSLLGQPDVAGTAGLLQDIELDSSTVLAEGKHSAPTRMDVAVVSALGFGGNTAALAIASVTP